MNNTLSVIGIGKLGLPLAALYANRGYNVIGLDLNEKVVESVNKGVSPIYEPGLDDLLKKHEGRLKATTDFDYAVKNSYITFILVPTPSEESGSFSNKYIIDAVEKTAHVLKEKKGFHIVVITSTVMPGTCENVVKPLLEKNSGKKCGVDFGLCYNPEFIALGSVIRDLSTPDAILIGESDNKSGDMLSEVYRKVCSNNPPIHRTTFVNAELAKISLNVFITTKITLANTFAEMCEKLPGGDVDAVTGFLGLDSRIGPKYLKGGLGYGGPCFPRDNLAFINLAKQQGVQAWLQETTHKVNQHQNERLVEIVEHRLGKVKGARVSFLGITYKSNTDVVEESAALKAAQKLHKEGAFLKIYDPAGNENTRRKLGDHNIEYAQNALDCIKDAEFVILATGWDEFKKLKPEDFKSTNNKKVVLLDCWRFFNENEFKGRVDYIKLGHGVA